METRKIVYASIAVAAGAVLLVWLAPRYQPGNDTVSAVSPPAPAQTVPAASNAPARPVSGMQAKIKHRFSEYGTDEKAQFTNHFKEKLRPAIDIWGRTYRDHLPFSPDAVGVTNFIERIGVNSSFNEYVFVVNGITLAVQDSNGSIRVDYLNDPIRTRQMAALPSGAEPPETRSPITRQAVQGMLREDAGMSFGDAEVRMIPTGLSGALNGGVMVHVGGNPQNVASWKYDMVFGPDGKLAYYLRRD
jgi:hypothetical protein